MSTHPLALTEVRGGLRSEPQAPADHPRVLVAHPHPLYRDGLAAALAARGFEVVADCQGVRAMVEAIAATEPDALVLDDRDAAAILAELERRGLRVPALVIAADSEDRADVGAASGYLSKRADGGEISGAVRRILAGERVIDYAIVRESGRSQAATPTRLSQRELEVLALLAEGLSVQRIANRLFVSPGTVKSHLQNLYGKLEVSERAAAVAEGMRRGIIR